MDEVLADAEGLVASPRTRTLGNWPLNQLLMHLAHAMTMSIEGIPFKAPWYIRVVGPVIKRRILRHGMSPGFKLPKEGDAASYRAAGSDQAALEILRQAIQRVKTEQMSSGHPVFGRMTHEEWRRLHLRHAELHLSFVRPE